MTTIDFSQFHELAEEFRGEMSLVKICEMEGVDYRSYISWRSRNGLCERRRHQSPVPPSGSMVEMEVERVKVRHQASPGPSPKALRVGIEFENGLKFVRDGMDIDTLIDFLTKLRPALCLG